MQPAGRSTGNNPFGPILKILQDQTRPNLKEVQYMRLRTIFDRTSTEDFKNPETKSDFAKLQKFMIEDSAPLDVIAKAQRLEERVKAAAKPAVDSLPPGNSNEPPIPPPPLGIGPNAPQPEPSRPPKKLI